ncbi:MAG: DUF2190 family protein [Candidatus Aminicenantes bacterium]|nr:DUF2190 family protein [Candidatus Aminicenantes bacterium]
MSEVFTGTDWVRSGDYESLRVTAVLAQIARDLVLLNDLYHIVIKDVVIGELYTGITRCHEIILQKKTGVGESFNHCQKVYIEAVSGLVTPVATGNVLCGHAHENGAGESDTDVMIHFDALLALS